MRFLRGVALFTACLVLLALAGDAVAAPAATDRATAIALSNEARKLMWQGSYSQACAKFAESLRLDPRVATRFDLAKCQEKTGMLASAWANYVEVASGTQRGGQTMRARAARKRAEALEPKLATLHVEVADPVEGLVITRDGEPVPSAQWNVAVPVDPGTYRLRAAAPAHEAREYDVLIDEPGQAARVEIAPLVKKVKARQEQPGDEATKPASEAPATEGPAAGDDGSPLTTAGLIVGGIGLAQAIAGAVLLNLGDDMMAEADEMCPDRICPPSDTGTDYVAMWKKGRDLGYMGIITLVGGQATLIIGIVMLGFGGEDDESGQARAPLWIEPRFDHGSASLTVGGSW